MHRLESRLHQLGRPGRLPQVLVELEVLEDEVEATGHRRLVVAGLEPHRFVFHLGDPRGVFGLRLGQKVGLEAADLGVPTPARQRVDVQAHEEIAGLGAVAAAVAERDQRVGGPGHPHPDAAALELVAEQDAHLQGHILLPDAPRKEGPRVPGIDPAVTRIDGDDVPRPEPVGQALDRAPALAGAARRSMSVDQPCPAPIVAEPLAQIRGKDFGDELKRQEQRVAAQPRPARPAAGAGC